MQAKANAEVVRDVFVRLRCTVLEFIAIPEGYVICHFHSLGTIRLGVFGEFYDEGLVGSFIWDGGENEFHIDGLPITTVTSKLLRSMVHAFI